MVRLWEVLVTSRTTAVCQNQCVFSLKLRLKANGRRLFQEKYNTHHVNPVEDGGDVYNLDTLAIAAPKTHAEAHAEIDEKKKKTRVARKANGIS